MLCVEPMSWADNFTFKVEPRPNTDKFMPVGGWGSVMPPVSPWTAGAISSQQTPALQVYQTDENLKKQYGIELAKANNPFEAARKVFGDNDKAVWASINWLSDAIVIASRDAYLKTLEVSQPPLDREQLAAKLLALADEKILTDRGILVPTIEAKDRIAALKLYSEVLGYTGKVEINNSTTKTINNNKLEIILVKADEKKPVVIDNAPNAKSEILNDKTPSPISLKLVKAS